MKYLDNEVLYSDNYATIECISKKFGNFKVLIDLEDVEKVIKYHWNIKACGKKKEISFMRNHPIKEKLYIFIDIY